MGKKDALKVFIRSTKPIISPQKKFYFANLLKILSNNLILVVLLSLQKFPLKICEVEPIKQ